MSFPFRLSVKAAVVFFGVTILSGSAPVQANEAPPGRRVTGADFVVRIPSGGSTSERVEEVSLGGSQVLAVIDESNNAVFMPQQGGSGDAKESERLNEIVYAVESGKCDPERTLTYEEVFPALGASTQAKSFWVKAKADASSNSVTNYVFTNPPAEKLEGRKVSFCVRFRSPSVTGVTTPKPQTPATTAKPTITQSPTSPPTQNPSAPTEETTKDTEGNQDGEGEVSMLSLRALIEKDSTGAAQTVKVMEEPMASPKRDGDSKGYDLVVIIHSSASPLNLHTVSVLAVLATSISALLHGAGSFWECF